MAGPHPWTPACWFDRYTWGWGPGDLFTNRVWVPCGGAAAHVADYRENLWRAIFLPDNELDETELGEFEQFNLTEESLRCC